MKAETPEGVQVIYIIAWINIWSTHVSIGYTHEQGDDRQTANHRLP